MRWARSLDGNHCPGRASARSRGASVGSTRLAFGRLAYRS